MYKLTPMSIGLRLRAVRQIRGWKQIVVADSMHVTQQTYSKLERGKGSPEVDTLKRFCNIMNVQLHFLLAMDVPVTEENLEKYGTQEFSKIISDCIDLAQKLAGTDTIIMDTFIPSQSHEIQGQRVKAA